MFTPEFDWTLAAVLFVLAVVFFLGKGEEILKAFSGRNTPAGELGDVEKLRYQQAVAVFLLILSCDEVFMALFPGRIMGIVSIVVTVAALAGICVYARKLFGEK